MGAPGAEIHGYVEISTNCESEPRAEHAGKVELLLHNGSGSDEARIEEQLQMTFF